MCGVSEVCERLRECKSRGQPKGTKVALGEVVATKSFKTAVASTDRCKRSGFVQEVKNTDATYPKRFELAVDATDAPWGLRWRSLLWADSLP